MRLFDELRTQMYNRLQIAWRPRYLISDFEGALIKARMKFWPNLPHKGCFFHLKQTIRRYAINDCGLTEHFKQLGFRLFFHKIGALALIPQFDIPEAWTHLKSSATYTYAADPGVRKLIKYVDENWAGNSPAYLPRMWNHYTTLMAKDSKTTSELESHHKTMNANCEKVKKGSPDGFWKVYTHYCRELVHATRIRVVQLRANKVRKKTSTGQKRRDREQDELRRAVEAYNVNDIGGSLGSIAMISMRMRLRRPAPPLEDPLDDAGTTYWA
jgi:hypothetical protein